MRHVMRHGPRGERGDQRLGHAVGDLVERGGIDRIAEMPVEASALGMGTPGGIEADDLEILVDDLQATADMDGSGRQHLAAFEQWRAWSCRRRCRC